MDIVSPYLCFAHICKGDEVIIDVRSEGEFAKASFPNTILSPILTNERRHLIGLCFKNHGQAAAIELGHKLVSHDRTVLVDNWLRTIGKNRGIVFCWRGGLRSQIACDWITAAGGVVAKVEGGYKAMRNVSLKILQRPRNLLVLSGMTGVGKTDLLHKIPWHIDLESYANHRGSAFGAFLWSKQPYQAAFENRLAVALFAQSSPTLLVEDESYLIGRCAIPKYFYQQMSKAPLVILEESLEERVKRLKKEYIDDPIKHGVTHEALYQHMLARLVTIRKKLGGLLMGQISTALQEAFTHPDDGALHGRWIKLLLTQYYDRIYAFSHKRRPRSILFEGDAQACSSWLSEYQQNIELPYANRH